MCCTHAARWKYRTQKIAKNLPSAHHRTTLSGYIFATKACIDSRKNLLNSNIFPTRPYNMVNFGLLAAEIFSLVWGTPANVNTQQASRLGSVTARHCIVVSVSKTLRRCTEGATYVAGRPSRWALTYILVASMPSR